MSMRKVSKVKRKINSSKRDFKLVFSTVIFMILIGSAFAIDWIFGLGFVLSFILAIYNKTVEKNIFIPFFIFLGALLIRYGLGYIPAVIEAKTAVNLAFSLLMLLVIVFVGWQLKRIRLKKRK